MNEIAQCLVEDDRPSGNDGAANSDRLRYILEVFGCESIDIYAAYDYTNVSACKDPDMVEACKHLAILQMQYLRECADHGLIEREESDVKAAFLVLGIQKMNWHLDHLEKGRKTPPFPFIH